MYRSFRLRLSGLFLAGMVLFMAGCSDRDPQPVSVWPPGQLPPVNHMLEILQEFEYSAWDGCNDDFERGQILTSRGYQNYWVCRGNPTGEHRYALTILAGSDGVSGQYLKLEFRRGEEYSMNAMIRYFLRMAGADTEQERIDLRSSISLYLITPPDVRDYVPIAVTGNGLSLEMGFNRPHRGYTTLRIRARLPGLSEEESDEATDVL